MEKPWLKSYDEGVPASIEIPNIPLDQLLTDAAAKHPYHTATIFGARIGSRILDRKLSYSQLNELRTIGEHYRDTIALVYTQFL